MCNFGILISRYRCSNKGTVNLPGSIACLLDPLSNKIILFLKHIVLAILKQNYISIKIMFAQCFQVKENSALLIRTTIHFYLIHLPLDLVSILWCLCIALPAILGGVAVFGKLLRFLCSDVCYHNFFYVEI